MNSKSHLSFPEKLPEWPLPEAYLHGLENRVLERMAQKKAPNRNWLAWVTLPLAAALALLIWWGNVYNPQRQEQTATFHDYLLDNEGLTEDLLVAVLLESEWEAQKEFLIPYLIEEENITEEEIEAFLL